MNDKIYEIRRVYIFFITTMNNNLTEKMYKYVYCVHF